MFVRQVCLFKTLRILVICDVVLFFFQWMDIRVQLISFQIANSLRTQADCSSLFKKKKEMHHLR